MHQTLCRRKPVWIALSNLWLDTEMEESTIAQIAEVVRQSGFSAREIDDIFTYELAPFLAANLWAPAGEWSGFDPDWVCAEAEKRMKPRSISSKVLGNLGITTKGAREEFERVKEQAFGQTTD